MPEWTLIPGEGIRHTELHSLFGGAARDNISVSTTPSVFVFSDSASGNTHADIDGRNTRRMPAPDRQRRPR
jgi:hypothetical protein